MTARRLAGPAVAAQDEAACRLPTLQYPDARKSASQQAMTSDFRVLALNDSLKRAVELTLTGSQKDFPVVSDGILEGVLRQTDLLKALSERDVDASVASWIERDYVTVDSRDMLDAAFSKLKECDCHTLPVTLDGKLVGLVTMENLGEFMRIRSALNN